MENSIMKNVTGRFTAILTALFLMLGFFVLVNPANAQTKKKKTKKQSTSTSTQQPVPQQNTPTIISQADQYQDQNQQIITGNVEMPTEPQPEIQTETQPETYEEKLDKLNNRLKSLEGAKKGDSDEKQKRLLLNLDILTRAEGRAEALRKQLFELAEKENTIKLRLETIDYDIRPEMIERQVATTGTLRPEELRELKKKNLEAEKTNLQNLLTQIQSTRMNLEQNVQKADQLVEKLRAVLEKDIDNALIENPKEQ